MFKNGKVTVLGNPCPAILFVVRFPSRNLKCHTKKGVYWWNLMCFANDFGWLKLFIVGNLFRARPFSRKSPAPHWGDTEFDLHDGPLGPASFSWGKWQIHFDLKRIFSNEALPAHTPPFAHPSWGQDHQTRQWCAPSGWNSKATQKTDGGLNMNNSRDWWLILVYFFWKIEDIFSNRRTYCNKNPPWNLTSSPKKPLKKWWDLEEDLFENPFWGKKSAHFLGVRTCC